MANNIYTNEYGEKSAQEIFQTVNLIYAGMNVQKMRKFCWNSLNIWARNFAQWAEFGYFQAEQAMEAMCGKSVWASAAQKFSWIDSVCAPCGCARAQIEADRILIHNSPSK